MRLDSHSRATHWYANYAIAVCLFALVCGCASTHWVTVRDTPRNPLAGTLGLMTPGGPKPTKRTMQLLRRYDLVSGLREDRADLLLELDELQQREPSRELDYAIAEIAYVTAKEAESLNRARALEFHSTALLHAYRYLFAYDGELRLNPYDPQFRGASDLYNQSLEGVLRIMRRDGELRPGESRMVKTTNHTCLCEVVLKSKGWHAEDLDRCEFVSDYRVKGLRNHYHYYGLGVPLIAVRRSHENSEGAEGYYPPSVCFPLTAFLRVESPEAIVAGESRDGSKGTPKLVLELYDTLERPEIEIAGRVVPLEADLSTPLAYFLQQPEFQDGELSWEGLFRPGDVQDLQGLYMLEPYDPAKMPVVMVHGLYSSPITWMEMYNDLRSDPLVRRHYQFWFYFYPTGQPFWNSATQMREDLAMMRRKLDPLHQQPALDQMVLVGHSMGGLVSKLQTVSSGEEFWRTMSDHELASLVADEDDIRAFATTFFFQPSPSVRRVVTIGTPHRGSEFSNGITRWLGNKFIAIPSRLLRQREDLVSQNPGFFLPDAPINIRTSIGSLSPESPWLAVLLESTPGPWVSYHNVVGRDPDPGWEKYLVGDGDGVVSLESAQLEGIPHVKSEIVVAADHMGVHRHPQCILEVRRVLLEQIGELKNYPNSVEAQIAGRGSTMPPAPEKLPDGAAGELR